MSQMVLSACGSMLFSFIMANSLARGRSEFVSDLLTPPSDDSRALKIRAEEFWQSFVRGAEDLQMEDHLKLYEDAQKEIAQLTPEHEYARKGLQESLARLRRADESVLLLLTQSSQLALERLVGPVTVSGPSFLFGGQGFIAQAIRRFAMGGNMFERFNSVVDERQAEVLPVLRDTSSAMHDVLSDCRIASSRAVDVLKYDIYHKLRGAPTTPRTAKTVANRLWGASVATRQQFTRFLSGAAGAIGRDTERKGESASATVLRSSLESSGLNSVRDTGADGPLISL